MRLPEGLTPEQYRELAYRAANRALTAAKIPDAQIVDLSSARSARTRCSLLARLKLKGTTEFRALMTAYRAANACTDTYADNPPGPRDDFYAARAAWYSTDCIGEAEHTARRADLIEMGVQS